MRSLFKFLAGILLLQGATALLGLAALRSDQAEVRALLGLLALTLGAISALWFASMAGSTRREALARAQQGFTEEREALRLRAEREKARLLADSQRKLARARNRLQGRANLKVGAAFAGVAGLGALMMLTQFVTVGLLTLAAGGGAAAGYFTRVRQERRRRSGFAAALPRGVERPALPGETVDIPGPPTA
jgi:4-amino-4-deoxy-L-arabinose transferase-like glycosyltransferase